MTKKQKKMLYRILIAAVLFLAAKFIPMPMLVSTVLYFAAYVTIGYDILRKAWKGICNHQVFDENFLMAVATIGAIALAIYEKSGDYDEAVAVMLFYQIGELFQSYAVGKSRRNITALMDIRPDYANIERNGKLEQVDPDDVAVGTVITVQPGEKIPIDGEIVEGSSTLNTAALTGESLPRDVMTGDEVISGCINMTGVLKVKTTKAFGESTVSKILELMENSSSHKSRSEAFISRFARVYTPAVCYSALALAILPPVINLLMGNAASWGVWVYRALTFLVISCPCALVISIPLSFFAGLGGASHEGILIKGSNYLEALSKTKIVVFDKTGTLTNAEPVLDKVIPFGSYTEEEVLRTAACIEEHFPHSMARAIVKGAEKRGVVHAEEHAEVNYIVAHGIATTLRGERAVIGSRHFVCDDEGVTITSEQQAKIDKTAGASSVIYLAVGGSLAGVLCIIDPPRPEAARAVALMKKCGIENVVMLTGDSSSAAEKIAQQLGITEVHAQVLPEDKHSHIEALKNQGRCVIMVGDGINDAPALAAADVSVAMSDASDIAKETADITIRDAELTELAVLRMLSERLMERINSNYRFILTFNTALLALGFFGVITPSMSALLHNGSTIAICVKSMTPLLRGDDKAM